MSAETLSEASPHLRLLVQNSLGNTVASHLANVASDASWANVFCATPFLNSPFLILAVEISVKVLVQASLLDRRVLENTVV
jgi:hypothetical protein